MWCEQCQSDVATEISADGQQLLCTTCRQPVRQVVAPSLHPETKSAREFLERWAREQQALKADSEEKTPPPSEQSSGTSSSDSASSDDPHAEKSKADESGSVEDDKNETGSGTTSKKWRLDRQHDAPSGPMPSYRDRPRRPHHLEKVSSSTDSPDAADDSDAADSQIPKAAPPTETAASTNSERRYRLDEEEAMAHGPHFDVRAMPPQKSVFPGRTEAIWGQLLAYAGVGLLTVGTIFVLWGYFGELEQYASTGWLISTAGQMLLLLGIVTLVGGGMQQTTHEVAQRIEHLGGRIIRIEESTDKILKAPHFNRRRRRRSRKSTNEDREAA